jgi:phosphoribosylformylglycinamidine synthase subunit PurQ / glutaminase
LNVAVLRFPGSNCDLDVVEALRSVEGVRSKLVWHESDEVGRFDAAVLPGGFTFGDYLRAGAIASRSPAIARIRKMAEEGKPILGICNGFQILVEASLLPGSLQRNSGLKFVCRWVNLRVENGETPFTRAMKESSVVRMPIAHGEGRYFASADEVRKLERAGRIVFRYVNDQGERAKSANPNGSLENIAGICNAEGNVVGMMPHPERASDPVLSPKGACEGRLLFSSLANFVREAA